LFLSALEHEVPVMRWLEDHVGVAYCLVIEIGANPGLYPTFSDALMKASPAFPDARECRIASFQPSGEACRRLLANLAIRASCRRGPQRPSDSKRPAIIAVAASAGALTTLFLRRRGRA